MNARIKVKKLKEENEILGDIIKDLFNAGVDADRMVRELELENEALRDKLDRLHEIVRSKM